MNERYSLVFKGEIAPGQDPDQVRERVRNLLKVTPEQLDRIFSGRKISIKKGLDSGNAGGYHQAFEATGAVCTLEKETAKTQLSPLIPQVKKILCPKCGMEQPKTQTCAGCGIIMTKYRRQQEAQLHSLAGDGHHLPGTTYPRGRQTEGTPRAGALGAFVRILIIVTLVAAGGYAGYRKLAQPAEGNILFSSDACGDPCRMALEHLQRERVEFTVCNIDTSEDNLKKYRKFGTNILPLTVLGDTEFSGYKQADYQILIDMALGRYMAESAGKVVLYTTSTCGHCRRARDFFNQRGIDFTENDIADPRNRMRYEKLRGRGVPLVLIDGRRIDGFNPQVVTEMLDEAGIM